MGAGGDVGNSWSGRRRRRRRRDGMVDNSSTWKVETELEREYGGV